MKRFVPFVFFVIFFSVLILRSETAPRIFILHSYPQETLWVKYVNKGIDEILRHHPDYRVTRHTMGLERNASFTQRQQAGVYARQLVSDFHPRVLIAIDDEAQFFVSKFYVDLPDIQIVYAGVDGSPRDYGLDLAQNATGILERLPLQALREFLPLLFPRHLGPIRVVHMGEASLTVKNHEKDLYEFDWRPLALMDSITVDSFENWQKTLLRVAKQADCLYLTRFDHLKRSETDPRPVPPKEIIAWTQKQTNIPIIGSHPMSVYDGLPYAIATSPMEQGRIAMEQAVSLIQGTPMGQLKPQKSQEFLVVLQSGGKDPLPLIYTSFAKSMGQYIEKRP